MGLSGIVWTLPRGIGEEQTGHLAGTAPGSCEQAPQRRRWHPLTATEFLPHVHHLVAASRRSAMSIRDAVYPASRHVPTGSPPHGTPDSRKRCPRSVCRWRRST